MLVSMGLWSRRLLISADICSIKCGLFAMPPARKKVVSWGKFFSKKGKVLFHVIRFLEVKAFGSALQIQPGS